MLPADRDKYASNDMLQEQLSRGMVCKEVQRCSNILNPAAQQVLKQTCWDQAEMAIFRV